MSTKKTIVPDFTAGFQSVDNNTEPEGKETPPGKAAAQQERHQ